MSISHLLIINCRINVGQYPTWVIALCFFGPLTLGIAYLIYSNRFNSQWNKGIFPERLPFTRDNLIEAYICLAALMIQNDRRDLSEKMRFMNSFFSKHFPESYYQYADSLKWSYGNPIKPKTVAFWVNKHIREESKRSQILYFLTGLAMQDGQLITNEYAILKEITPLLGLTQKDLDAIIATYNFKKEENTGSQQQSSEKHVNRSARVEIAYQILGIPFDASIQEIKAAHRKLVKLHHPDRFANESIEQITLATERFQKIQDAYELLDKLKG